MIGRLQNPNEKLYHDQDANASDLRSSDFYSDLLTYTQVSLHTAKGTPLFSALYLSE